MDTFEWRRNVSWLTAFPSSWERTEFRRVLRLRRRANVARDDRLLSLSTRRGIVPKAWDNENQVRTGEDLWRYWAVQRGDLVINPMWLSQGSIAVARIDGVISPDYRVFEASSDVEARFLSYVLLSREYRSLYELFVRGDTTYDRRVSQDDIDSIPLALPGVEVQRAIADFLDRKTAAIDELIRKKERLIELLEEKRQALITQAVTKGLDPNVPTKDSGVEWIGEVPAHWRTPRIGYVARVRNGSTPDRANLDYWDEGTVPWLSSGKVNDYLVTEADQFITEVARRECHLEVMPAHSVIVGLIGQGKTRGTAAITTLPACINQNMAAISTFEGTDPWFLLHVLTSAYWPLREFGRGGQQDALNCQILAAFRIPLPPPDEQDRIVRWIDAEVVRKDGTAQLLAESIDRLREYRQALITGAVTGQLDIPAEPAV